MALAGEAWLREGDRLWLARGPWRPERADTPLLRLIRGIWRVWPAQALRLLRLPIGADRPLHRLEREAVRVAAKRAREVGPPAPARCVIDVSAAGRRLGRGAGLGPPPGLADGEPLELAERLAGLTRRTGPRWRQDRAVGAVLVLPDGAVGAWARNTGGRSRVRHAELELVRRWTAARGRLPPGSKVVVSLQPCRMCAAAIVAASEGEAGVEVIYGAPDPGKHAAHTWLDELGLLSCEAGARPHLGAVAAARVAGEVPEP